MEALPLPDASVDVVISNGVISLSPRKVRVLSEAFRVLRPGGRLAIVDLVLDHDLPPDIQTHPAAWAGCRPGRCPRSPSTRSVSMSTGAVLISVVVSGTGRASRTPCRNSTLRKAAARLVLEAGEAVLGEPVPPVDDRGPAHAPPGGLRRSGPVGTGDGIP